MNLALGSYRLIVVMPWLWLAVFYAFVLRARLFLGTWPVPYRPDPKDLGFHGHSVFIILLFLCVPLAVLAWSVLTPRRKRRSEETLRPSLAFWCGVGLIVLVVAVDPGRFLEWFMD